MLNEIDKKLIDLQNEFKYLANMYDLHIIEVVNMFHDALLDTYGFAHDNFSVDLNTKNQVIFYNFKEKKEHIFNLSVQKFTALYKSFSNKIQKRSDINLLSSFYDKLSKSQYLELKIVSRSRKVLHLATLKNERLYKNISFKCLITTRFEEEFIKNNKTFLIKLLDSDMDRIKNQNLLKEKISIDCNIIDYSINKKLINHFFKKIYDKSNGKFSLSIKFFNKSTNTIHVTCNSFIPLLFIKYIERYININTSYKVNLLK